MTSLSVAMNDPGLSLLDLFDHKRIEELKRGFFIDAIKNFTLYATK
jgi:hypothetical protein